MRIADKTGSINLSVWNEHGSVLRDGDILRLVRLKILNINDLYLLIYFNKYNKK